MKCNCELHAAPHLVHVSRLTPLALLGFAHGQPRPGRDPLPSPPRRPSSPAGGTVRPVTRWGTEVMHRKARPVTSYDEELRSLVADMVATMYAADGVGLAACQIGVDLAVFVFDCPDDEGTVHRGVVCNPVLVLPEGKDRQLDDGEEGCLSYPGAFVESPAPTTPGWSDRAWTGGRRLRGQRPVGALPAARDRPHLGHRVRRPVQQPGAQEAAQADGGGCRGLPGQWPVGRGRDLGGV